MIPKRGKKGLGLTTILLTGLLSTAMLAGQRGGNAARPATVAAPLDDASMVYVYVSLTDKQNNPIAGLGPADFEIAEDGTLQRIAEFTVDTAPVSVGVVWGPNVPLGNTILSFLRACPPNSEYFLVSNDTVVAPFSTDLKKAPRVVAQNGLELFPSGGKDAIHIGLDVLSEASAYIRRILLVVGRTTPRNQVSRPAFGNGATYESLTKTAVRNGMQIYTIGVEGTASSPFIGLSEGPAINPVGRNSTPGLGGAFDGPGMSSQTNTPASGISGFGGLGNLSVNGVSALGRAVDQSQDVIDLQNMAEMTGGRAYYVQNTETGIGGNDTGELEDVAESIARGLQLQYRIGYRSTNTAKDGKWRSIQVRLASQIEANMWTRNGYYAPQEPKKK